MLSELEDASSLLAMERVPTILVDDLVTGESAARKGACRLATTDLTEIGIWHLHHMAKLLALQGAWFEENETLPHYPLQSVRKRGLAILHGAEPVSASELESQCSRTLSRGSAAGGTALPPTFMEKKGQAPEQRSLF